MTYLLIIAATTLAGACVMSLLPDARSGALYDRVLVASVGAVIGLGLGLMIAGIAAIGG